MVKGGGGNGVDPDPELTLEDKLAIELDNNPSFLIDCNLAKKFKDLVNYKAPTLVNNRILSLNKNSSHSLFSDPFYVQQINNAYGFQINLDRLEIDVSMLPVINGRRLQPSEFLEYIRLNMNAFIDQGITSFLPYNDPNDNFNDIQKWHSNDPLGSILHLNIDGDNGSVLLTDYNQTHWTVSTLRTPLDREHPVSGNRSWGYTQDSDGYHFYVTGADRLTSIQHELANVLFNLPFSKSDELWTGFQEGVKFFVNTHQGKAEVGLKITERPNFNKLKDYFEGRITIKQLKDLKGCL